MKDLDKALKLLEEVKQGYWLMNEPKYNKHGNVSQHGEVGLSQTIVDKIEKFLKE